jgi:transcriptional regulator with XRE-family HTH domain
MKIGEVKRLKSNIGKLIDLSPYKRVFFQRRYNKTANTISNWCTGKSYPSAIEIFDLAEILDCSVEELYERIE